MVRAKTADEFAEEIIAVAEPLIRKEVLRLVTKAWLKAGGSGNTWGSILREAGYLEEAREYESER